MKLFFLRRKRSMSQKVTLDLEMTFWPTPVSPFLQGRPKCAKPTCWLFALVPGRALPCLPGRGPCWVPGRGPQIPKWQPPRYWAGKGLLGTLSGHTLQPAEWRTGISPPGNKPSRGHLLCPNPPGRVRPLRMLVGRSPERSLWLGVHSWQWCHLWWPVQNKAELRGEWEKMSFLGTLSSHAQNAVTGTPSLSDTIELEKDMIPNYEIQLLSPKQDGLVEGPWGNNHRTWLWHIHSHHWTLDMCLELRVLGFPCVPALHAK